MKREECKKGRYCLGIYTSYRIGQGNPCVRAIISVTELKQR